MTRHRDHSQDRRREPRRSDTGIRGRVRPGYRLIIIDVSSSGALVEAGRPLRPGSFIDVHLETDVRRGILAARVLRCAVAAIDSESGVTYRAALSFNESSDWVREALTHVGYDLHCGASAVSSPASGQGEGLPVAIGCDAREETPKVRNA